MDINNRFNVYQGHEGPTGDQGPECVIHEDLEERFRISTEVSFDSKEIVFQGLEKLEIEIQKKKEPQKIESIELGRPKQKRGLF